MQLFTPPQQPGLMRRIVAGMLSLLSGSFLPWCGPRVHRGERPKRRGRKAETPSDFESLEAAAAKREWRGIRRACQTERQKAGDERAKRRGRLTPHELFLLETRRESAARPYRGGLTAGVVLVDGGEPW